MQLQETPSLSARPPVDTVVPLPVEALAQLPDETLSPFPAGSAAADEKLQVLYQRWLELLEQQQLYQLEFGITLAQAARKLQVPARQLSQAVNQCYGASFSVLLNDKRISKAKQLLLQNPPLAVTDVMYQAGFATKSNFHKEFVRVTGKTPGAYRASAAMPPD